MEDEKSEGKREEARLSIDALIERQTEIPTQKSLLDMHIKSVKEVLSKGTVKNLVPHLSITAVDTENKKLVSYSSDVEIHQDKHSMMRNIGRAFVDRKELPIAAVLSCEAWFKKFPLINGKVSAPDDEPEDTPPSESKYRSEGIIFSSADVTHESFISFAEIERDAQGFIKPLDNVTDKFGEAQNILLGRIFEGCRERIIEIHGDDLETVKSEFMNIPSTTKNAEEEFKIRRQSLNDV